MIILQRKFWLVDACYYVIYTDNLIYFFGSFISNKYIGATRGTPGDPFRLHLLTYPKDEAEAKNPFNRKKGRK